MTVSLQRRQWLSAAVAGVGASLAACQRQRPESTMDGSFSGVNVERGHHVRDHASAYATPTADHTRRTRVLIAGGGVAGLAAARALRLRGIDDFALFDLEDDAGGNSRGGMLGAIACPLGAHYLPVPNDDACEVQDFLEEMGLRRRVSGRWQYDERHLCHSPQERLYFEGHWQEGLLPVEGVGTQTLAQYHRFSQGVEAAQAQQRFAIPAFKTAWGPRHQALDAVTFAAWLESQGLDDPYLLWYLDYCCRDDYGAGIATVSAWAGIHYFASRHGFTVPGLGPAEHDGGILTWPDGNATLTRALLSGLGDRVHTASSVLRVRVLRHGVEVDVLNHHTATVVRWQAQHCILALPVHIAARVVDSPPAALQAAAQRVSHAPWTVTNLHLHTPLHDRPGAAPAWDNVIYTPLRVGGTGLGYVDARHQSLDPRPGPTVLTHYRALGGNAPTLRAARHHLLTQPWQHWRDATLAELSVAHPDLPSKVTRMAITRYGHAMAIPTPGTLDFLRKIDRFDRSSKTYLLSKSERLSFAHSDWSGYSIFEEAFTRGHWAGSTLSP